MAEKEKYLIVNASVLPEVFMKVINAKELIASNKAKNPTKACEMVGLSRSTFYRYRNCVEIFDDDRSKTVTLYLNLLDKPGVLASVLEILRNADANVLTINQSIPINGVAPVCISLRENGITNSIVNATEKLRMLDTVVDAKLIQF